MLGNLLDVAEVASGLPGTLPVWSFLPNQAISQKQCVIFSTLKYYHLHFSTNKPKNAAQVYCAALVGRGALALLIIYR